MFTSIHACLLVQVWSIATGEIPGYGKTCGPCYCYTQQDKYGSAEVIANCSNAGLNEVPNNLPENVNILDLSNNALYLKDSLKNLQIYRDNLIRLSLGFCNISRIDRSVFFPLKHLEELDITGNILDSVHSKTFSAMNLRKLKGIGGKTFTGDSFSQLSRLEVLSVVFFNDYIDNEIFKHLNVYHLEVTFVNAIKLPPDIFQFGSNTLTILSITASELIQLPRDIFMGLTVLKTLYIKGSNIVSLQNELFYRPSNRNMPVHLTNVTLIDIKSVPRDMLRGQMSLRHLTLNGIDDIPAMELPRQLDTLDLSDSFIYKISSESISNLGNLRHLSLQNTSIATLDSDSLKGLSSLSSLDFSRNFISTLPAKLFLACENTLSILNISHNLLSEVTESDFGIAISLQTIDLSFNKIRTIATNAFDNLYVLNDLRLTGNLIQTLPASLFSNVLSLYSVALDQNSIVQIPRDIFRYTRHLQLVNLSENPVHCDCSIARLKERKRFLKIFGYCSTPAIYKGFNLDGFKTVDSCLEQKQILTQLQPSIPKFHSSFSIITEKTPERRNFETRASLGSSEKTVMTVSILNNGRLQTTVAFDSIDEMRTADTRRRQTIVTTIIPKQSSVNNRAYESHSSSISIKPTSSIIMSSSMVLSNGTYKRQNVTNYYQPSASLCEKDRDFFLPFIVSSGILAVVTVVVTLIIARKAFDKYRQRGTYIVPPSKRLPFNQISKQ